uniref:Uncharacterized protein n=1 Tax=Arundo donax TaxID=35708 RepID=A0A0A9GHY9_ARUDO
MGREPWTRQRGSRWPSWCPSSPAPPRLRGPAAAPRTAWRGWCGSWRAPGCSSTASAAFPPSSSSWLRQWGPWGELLLRCR